jgi:hypothetical protein
MRSFQMPFHRLLIFVLLAALLFCHLPARDQNGSEHRIGVRVVNGVGEFYDRVTGQKFVPRGNNFIRIGPQTDLSGARIVYHTLFDLGGYNASEAEDALRRMHANGYNVVRVFTS